MTSNVSIFNSQFKEFVNFVQETFPEDHDILSAKNGMTFIRKTNPKMIVKIWKKYIADKYRNEIDRGDLEFFINKDYNDDLNNVENSDKVLQSINKFREPVKKMNPEQQVKILRYVQNLSKLSDVVSA